MTLASVTLSSDRYNTPPPPPPPPSFFSHTPYTYSLLIVLATSSAPWVLPDFIQTSMRESLRFVWTLGFSLSDCLQVARTVKPYISLNRLMRELYLYLDSNLFLKPFRRNPWVRVWGSFYAQSTEP